MALTLARDYGATVTGITLSTEQLAEAQDRAEAEGLADRVSFQLLDYRAADQRFDRVVSVGMFEPLAKLLAASGITRRRRTQTRHTQT